jgi:Oxidoreductase molybdopterin binding domain/Mo-co oxidoreductase dimerisation domain
LDPQAVSGGHVELTGLDTSGRLGRRFNFGCSIRLEKALSAEVILAYEMNGRPLAPTHGFPLRALLPGYIGARSVKWLSRLTVQAQPSDNYFQARAYHLFAPYVTPETIDWSAGLMLADTPVTSAICIPQPGQRLTAGENVVRGYALAGGSRQVARVDLSADGGLTWRAAELEDFVVTGPASPDVSEQRAPGVGHAAANALQVKTETLRWVEQAPRRLIQREPAGHGLLKHPLAHQVPKHVVQGAGVTARRRGQAIDVGQARR